jgi:hypothetical protein
MGAAAAKEDVEENASAESPQQSTRRVRRELTQRHREGRRKVERDLKAVQREQSRVSASLRDAVRRGDAQAEKTLGAELEHSQAEVLRLETSLVALDSEFRRKHSELGPLGASDDDLSAPPAEVTEAEEPPPPPPQSSWFAVPMLPSWATPWPQAPPAEQADVIEEAPKEPAADAGIPVVREVVMVGSFIGDGIGSLASWSGGLVGLGPKPAEEAVPLARQ